MGIKVNITKAATLLAVCKLDAPPTTASPSPHSNDGSSLIPISGLSYAISGALVILFSRITRL
ncbi:unnamed protein product [Brassica oleracea var. botrytis]|uniref:(rape) hypothetical protein n=1 Tax=Brassica napus TaxID=3708 RepID=A0A816JC25_BRANA|nr:unnamed protein product [Brassica napus]